LNCKILIGKIVVVFPRKLSVVRLGGTIAQQTLNAPAVH